jgi:conjugal transfer pilus assembly protein TraV
MRSILPVVAVLLLAGCVNMSGLDGETKYACAAPEGVACDSVAGTYANALHQNLPSQRASALAGGSGAAGSAVAASAGTPPLRPLLQGALPAIGEPGGEPRAGAALRTAPRVLRLWTKPWEDADGDLWDQGYVYVQVDGGRWQLDHVQQRIRDRYLPLRPPPNLPTSAPPSGGIGGPTPAEGDPPAESLTDSLSRNLPSSPFGSFPTMPRLPTLPTPAGARQP